MFKNLLNEEDKLRRLKEVFTGKLSEIEILNNQGLVTIQQQLKQLQGLFNEKWDLAKQRISEIKETLDKHLPLQAGTGENNPIQRLHTSLTSIKYLETIYQKLTRLQGLFSEMRDTAKERIPELGETSGVYQKVQSILGDLVNTAKENLSEMRDRLGKALKETVNEDKKGEVNASDWVAKLTSEAVAQRLPADDFAPLLDILDGYKDENPPAIAATEEKASKQQATDTTVKSDNSLQGASVAETAEQELSNNELLDLMTFLKDYNATKAQSQAPTSPLPPPRAQQKKGRQAPTKPLPALPQKNVAETAKLLALINDLEAHNAQVAQQQLAQPPQPQTQLQQSPQIQKSKPLPGLDLGHNSAGLYGGQENKARIDAKKAAEKTAKEAAEKAAKEAAEKAEPNQTPMLNK